jgi:cyclohexa-1,5-dienecarbonyl-CoA hydratase
MSGTGASTQPLRVERHENGALWVVEIGEAKGNVIDTRMIDALISLFEEATETPELRVVCLHGRAGHFSYGASIEEHLPEAVDEMLPRFHRLFRVMAESAVVCVAAIRGQCLGGGLELASFCHRVFAEPDAKLGQPEIALGVFPPVASLILPERIGRANAEDLCLTGRVISATEAERIGLVDALTDEPENAALEYAKRLARHSASSLRFAVRALRYGLEKRIEEDLPALERLYLEELMFSADAVEGLRAFMDKRAPTWRNE